MSRLDDEDDDLPNKLNLLQIQLKGLQKKTDNLYNLNISSSNFSKKPSIRLDQQQSKKQELQGREFILDYINNIPDKTKKNNKKKIEQNEIVDCRVSYPSSNDSSCSTLSEMSAYSSSFSLSCNPEKSKNACVSAMPVCRSCDRRVKNNIMTCRYTNNCSDTEEKRNIADEKAKSRDAQDCQENNANAAFLVDRPHVCSSSKDRLSMQRRSEGHALHDFRTFYDGNDDFAADILKNPESSHKAFQRKDKLVCRGDDKQNSIAAQQGSPHQHNGALQNNSSKSLCAANKRVVENEYQNRYNFESNRDDFYSDNANNNVSSNANNSDLSNANNNVSSYANNSDFSNANNSDFSNANNNVASSYANNNVASSYANNNVASSYANNNVASSYANNNVSSYANNNVSSFTQKHQNFSVMSPRMVEEREGHADYKRLHRIYCLEMKRKNEEEWMIREQELIRHMNQNAERRLQQEIRKLNEEHKSYMRHELTVLEDKWKDKMQKFINESEAEKNNLLIERGNNYTHEMELKDSIQKLNNEKRIMQNKIDQLNNEVNYISKKIESLRKEQEATEFHRSEAQKSMIYFQTLSEDLKEKLKKEKNSSSALQIELDHANSQFNHMLNKNRQLEAKLAAAEEKKESHEKLCQNILLDKNEIETKYENTLKLNNNLKDECHKSSREIKKLQSEVLDLSEQINKKTLNEKNSNQIIDELREREKLLKEELKNFQHKIVSAEQAERELKKLKMNLDNTNLEVKRLRDENALMVSENKQLCEKESKLRLEIQAAKNEILSSRQEIHSLKKQLQNEMKNKETVIIPSEAHVKGLNVLNKINKFTADINSFSNITNPLHALNFSNTKYIHNSTANSAESPLKYSYTTNYNVDVGNDNHVAKNVYKVSSRANSPEGKITNLQNLRVTDKTDAPEVSDELNCFSCNAHAKYDPSHLNLNYQTSNTHTSSPALTFKHNRTPSFSSFAPKKEQVLFLPSVNDNSLSCFPATNIEDQIQQNRSLEQQLTLLGIERNKIESLLAKYPSTIQARTMKERQNKIDLDKRLSEVNFTIQKIRQELRFRKSAKN